MRLTESERDIIREEIKRLDPEARVFLFGSRTQIEAKGGDIDLLVESKILDFQAKIQILADIKAKIGDQKIDLIITKSMQDDLDPFIKLIAKEAKKL